jgi:glycosyltransferase involved in cell wall biosynthesis
MRREIVYLVGPSLRTNGGIGYAVALYFKSPLADQYELIHISTHREGNRLAKAWEFVKGLARFGFLKLTRGGRLVHIHAAYGPSFVRKLIFFIASKCLGCRIIYQIHAGYFDRYYTNSPRLTRVFLDYVLRTADAVVALSDSLKGEIGAVVRSCRGIHVIGNPLDVSKYKPIGQAEPSTGAHRLLFLGAVIKPKGVYDIIESARRLVSEGFPIRLTMAGDREIAQAKQRSEQAGLGGVIQFPGWVPEARKLELLDDADLLLLPSYTEGLPLSVLEAMACGLPIVCTSVGGLRDLVIHGENGFVIEPGDVDALTHYTGRLLRDKALRNEMGRNNIAKINKDYSIDVIAKKLGQLYGDLLAARTVGVTKELEGLSSSHSRSLL